MSMDMSDTIGPDSASAIWNLPYPRNANFTGRAKVLSDLRQAFTDKSPAHRVQIVSGLGGVGKTQLCTEYAYKHRWDYAIIWWISADDPSESTKVEKSIACDGCKTSRCCVLSRPNTGSIGAPCVLASLAFRSPQAGRHSLKEHRWT